MQPAIGTQRKPFTADEVMRMVEHGILREDDPLELLDGDLVVVTPQGPPHSTLVGLLQDLLVDAYRGTAHVRVHCPIAAGATSLPEPDLAVVLGRRRDYHRRHPSPEEVILAIEAASTSQQYDHAKLAVYARGEVEAVWIVDEPARRLEVFTGPRPDGTYRATTLFREQDEVALPGLTMTLPVRDMLP